MQNQTRLQTRPEWIAPRINICIPKAAIQGGASQVVQIGFWDTALKQSLQDVWQLINSTKIDVIYEDFSDVETRLCEAQAAINAIILKMAPSQKEVS